MFGSSPIADEDANATSAQKIDELTFTATAPSMTAIRDGH